MGLARHLLDQNPLSADVQVALEDSRSGGEDHRVGADGISDLQLGGDACGDGSLGGADRRTGGRYGDRPLDGRALSR